MIRRLTVALPAAALFLAFPMALWSQSSSPDRTSADAPVASGCASFVSDPGSAGGAGAGARGADQPFRPGLIHSVRPMRGAAAPPAWRNPPKRMALYCPPGTNPALLCVAGVKPLPPFL